MDAMTEETFGPTLPIMKVADAEEAIRLANDSPYGLGAIVFTKDVARGEAVARRVEAGAVVVNDAMLNYSALELPMGGWKASGLGSRHGAGGIRKYCRQQSILISRLPPRTTCTCSPTRSARPRLLLKGLPAAVGPRQAGLGVPTPARGVQGGLAASAGGRRAPVGSHASSSDEPQQVQRRERLGEEQVGARARRGAARAADAGGEHDDARPAQSVEARSARHAVDPVQLGMSTSRNTIRGRGPPRRLDRLLAVGRLDELEARDVLERRGDEPADERVVVDDEDGVRSSSRLSAGCCSSVARRGPRERDDDLRVELRPRSSGDHRARAAQRRRPGGRGGRSSARRACRPRRRPARRSGISSPRSPSG